MADEFQYNEEHQVIVCLTCQTCIVPTASGQTRHLRRAPHKLSRERLKTTMALLQQYELRTLEELAEDHASTRSAIPGLKIHQGFSCLQDGCGYCTVNLEKMKEHGRTTHSIYARATDEERPPHWASCALQTFFAATNRVKYFVVTPRSGKCDETTWGDGDSEAAFDKMTKTLREAREDACREAATVQPPTDEKAQRVPWLIRTGFEKHLQGLQDQDIQSSYALPKTAKDQEREATLVHVLAVADKVFEAAYKVCTDPLTMTQQRAQVLGAFHKDSTPNDRFREHKAPATLRQYFGLAKQMLAYFFRVTSDEGHFPRVVDEKGKSKPRPEDVIQPTDHQCALKGLLVGRVTHLDESGAAPDTIAADEEAGKHVLSLLETLFFQSGVVDPFCSPVLSYCAMIARRSYTRRGERGEQVVRGFWHEPGNYNSQLSGLIWVAQVVMLNSVVRAEDQEAHLMQRLRRRCMRYLRRDEETTCGHILQWRLYLFEVARHAITPKQALWTADGQDVTYDGTTLRMRQVTELAACTYSAAYKLLHTELLFGEKSMVAAIESPSVQDDLEDTELGGSWLTNKRNSVLLEGAEEALPLAISSNPQVRRAFLDGTDLSPKAIDIYEAHVQEFLQLMAVLVHLTPAPPLRSPELFSAMWKNSARRRHFFIWEKMVMLHVQYHKLQEKTGAYRDNIRYLPRPVGDLLLTFLAYVQPLRQIFLRQSRPTALLSPLLWSRLDGTPWKDTMLSSALQQACARARVPGFGVAWWRQVAASITKHMFPGGEMSSFMTGDDADEVEGEDEADMAALAESSNHSFHTFNHAYAGGTTLTMTVLLSRGFRASKCWHKLFDFDRLQPPPLFHDNKRRLAGGRDSETLQLVKRAKLRRATTTHTCESLLDAARQLFKDPGFGFRTAEQRDGILATLGPKPSEQVLVVLGTGAGKTLVVMLGASLQEAETTILILPTVALRTDMQRRLSAVGLRYHVWAPGSTRRAPVVLVSAEAACSKDFLEYAHKLVVLQALDRVVVDECHLTLTACSYRQSMRQLGENVRTLRTQTVWLTATLPPSMEAAFIEHNKLVRPTIIRAVTNRKNIRYTVVSAAKAGETAMSLAVARVKSLLDDGGVMTAARDRIIVYCLTRDEAAEAAGELECESYTSELGEDEKKKVIGRWLARPGQAGSRGEEQKRRSRVIVATTALGIGFDYPHVRAVVHAGQPRCMTDFAQESGRAGRDGAPAFSVVCCEQEGGAERDLPSSYDVAPSIVADDERAMAVYVRHVHCLRGVMSEFLDKPATWRWCMPGDEPCSVCREPHATDRPASEVYLDCVSDSANEDDAMSFTGPDEVARQAFEHDEVFRRYEKRVQTAAGTCLYCRFMQREFDHRAGSCMDRWDWIKPKAAVMKKCEEEKKSWMPAYVVCYNCFNPVKVCRAACSESGVMACEYKDLVLPGCYGRYSAPRGRAWFWKHFKVKFKSDEELMMWLGRTAEMDGVECIQANRVLSLALEELDDIEDVGDREGVDLQGDRQGVGDMEGVDVQDDREDSVESDESDESAFHRGW